MANLTKTVDGKVLPKEKFAYVGDPEDPSTWHLPIDGEHIKSALDLFGHEKHIPQQAMAATARRIAAAAKSHGVDKDSVSNFESKHCKSSAHADFGGNWVQIFRAGDYGTKGKFDESDLDRVAGSYDAGKHEAPACIGHPKDDTPAFGWVSALKRAGDTLLAKFTQVDPVFEDAVKAGRFKKRSAAFYLDSDGRLAGLRHVGFLGGQPPEVKGLENLNFDDHGRSFTEVEFGEEDGVDNKDNKSVKEQVAEFFAELFGKKSGDLTQFSEADVKRIAGEAVTAATKPLQEKVDELQGKLQAQATQFSEREKKIAGGETKQRAIDAENKLKAAGRWVPAFGKMGLPLVFAALAESTVTVEFGEGDSKKQVSHLDLLTQFLEGLPQIVPGGRVYEPGKTAGKSGGVHFTESKHTKADPNSIVLNEQAMKRAKEKGISFSEALDQIVTEQPELTVPGGARGVEV